MGAYYDDFSVDSSIEVNSVIGTETTDAMIAQLGMDETIANYAGFGIINIREQGANWSTYNANLRGDIDMEADFGAATVSGAMTDMTFEERSGEVVESEVAGSGSLVMNTQANIL